MANIDFYSVYDRKMIKVPEEDVELVKKGPREMLVGNIMVKGQKKQVWKIKPKALVWKKYKTSKKGGQHYHKNMGMAKFESAEEAKRVARELRGVQTQAAKDMKKAGKDIFPLDDGPQENDFAEGYLSALDRVGLIELSSGGHEWVIKKSKKPQDGRIEKVE